MWVCRKTSTWGEKQPECLQLVKPNLNTAELLLHYISTNHRVHLNIQHNLTSECLKNTHKHSKIINVRHFFKKKKKKEFL